MLMKIDGLFKKVPSKAINLITLGRKGQSMCGRLYLYQKNVSRHNVVVNILILVIDSIEKNHCRLSYRITSENYNKTTEPRS